MSKIGETIYQLVDSIDFLREPVTVIMSLDHTREYVHADAVRFSPADLTQTIVLLFFTRRITHPGAPEFVFRAEFSG